MEAALAGIREHVIVEDAIVAENGAAIVVTLDPMILLFMALNLGCAPEVLRTAPFLRSLVQQHTNTVFARFKQVRITPNIPLLVITSSHYATLHTSLTCHRNT